MNLYTIKHKVGTFHYVDTVYFKTIDEALEFIKECHPGHEIVEIFEDEVTGTLNDLRILDIRRNTN